MINKIKLPVCDRCGIVEGGHGIESVCPECGKQMNFVEFIRQPTHRAVDETICSLNYHLMLAEKGDTVCGVCRTSLRA